MFIKFLLHASTVLDPEVSAGDWGERERERERERGREIASSFQRLLVQS